ncbi:MAG: diguanylate cyclase [Anaerolineales bacterium]|nr:diguanylate cyclase [Anaerolineales bacterium]
MSTKTKSQLMEENTALLARLAELEDEGSCQGKKTPAKADQSARKQANESLRASEVRYRRLFETAKDGILLLDGDTGRITDVNPFLEDLLGYSHAELLDKALWEIGPVKDIAASQEAMRHLQNTEYIRYEDLPLVNKSGQHLQVEFVSNVYLVDGWRVIQCNIRDITVRKQAEARAERTLAELSGKVAELHQRDQQMQLLNLMNDLLRSCTLPTEAYKVIAMTARGLFPDQSGCLAVFHAADRELEIVAHWGADMIMEFAFPLEDCWALRRGQLHEVFDLQNDLLCRHFVHLPPAGYLCLPLTVQAETLGLICLTHAVTGQSEPLADQQQLIRLLGEAVKLTLSNLRLREKLREQATRDLLTGLFNRRYLDETLPRELSQAQRRKAPICVVMIDIDRFKDFNDAFGHGPGDSILREVGRVLQEQLREGDILCRYGGDEFVLILPDASLADTLKRVEQIRASVRAVQVQDGEQVLGAITFSAGISSPQTGEATSSELLRMADEAMYAAKQAGRDQTCVYKQSPQCSPPRGGEQYSPDAPASGEYLRVG